MATDVLIIDEKSAVPDVFAVYLMDLGDAIFTAPDERSGINTCRISNPRHS